MRTFLFIIANIYHIYVNKSSCNHYAAKKQKKKENKYISNRKDNLYFGVAKNNIRYIFSTQSSVKR